MSRLRAVILAIKTSLTYYLPPGPSIPVCHLDTNCAANSASTEPYVLFTFFRETGKLNA